MRAAVVELRDVAHGLFPTVLADEGLRAALEELSEQAPRLVPRALPAGRFAREVESAAYFAAVEALRLAAREVTVDAVAENGRLRVVIGAGDRARRGDAADPGPRRRRRRNGGGRATAN